MAPEQAEGERITGAVDAYALALTLYEGWTGSNPIKARGPAATARNVGRPLPRLRSRRRDLPERLCQAIDAALDPRPDRRPSLDVLKSALKHAAADLSEEGGLVEPSTLKRFGLEEGPARGRHREPAGWLERAGAAVGAGVLVLLALELLGPTPPASPAAIAGIAALAALVFPRIGWLVAAAGMIGWLGADQPGMALVALATIAATPLLLPRAGALWSVPALAPALGAIGLAPMYIAVAAFAPTMRRRAGLAAAGFLWLVGAEVITGKALLYGAADSTMARETWEGSISKAAQHALWPTLTTPVLAPILVFAAFAVLLRFAVRGRSLGLDVALGAAWAAGLVAALRVTDGLLAPHVTLATARGEVAGALVGLLLAVMVAHRRPGRAPVTAPTLP
jgi:hypothetical protein